MKIVMNRLEALSLAKAAESIAPSKATMDELRCVLLESGEDGTVLLAAAPFRFQPRAYAGLSEA